MTVPTAVRTTLPAQRVASGAVPAAASPVPGSPARSRGPLARVSDLRIGARLAGGFGAVMLLLVVLLAVAVTSISGQVSAGELVKQTQQMSQDTLQARYLAADMNGWQTAYALDIALQGARATADTSTSRAAYLTSASTLEAQLDKLAGGDWDAGEESTLTAVRKQLADFVDIDAQAMRDYRLGTPQGTAAGHGLVLGKEVELYKQVAGGLKSLSEAANQTASQELDSAQSAAASGRNTLLGVGLFALLLAGGLALASTRSVVRPINKVNVVLRALAEGDLTARADVRSRDEVGQMAAALTTAQESLRSTVEAISGNATALAAASEEMSATAGSIAASAEETSAQSGVVSAAAEQVSRNVQTVATGADEMGASIREISQNANEAARVGGTAVGAADATNAIIGRLGDSSRQIGDVVKVITSIAEQTNLLALNATIEAARAGEAGKGFAVVANEVKDLAQETAKATEDIGRRVLAIQSDTDGAVTAIAQISSVIARMNDFQTTIASAVEEQTATTSEMTRNVAEAALGSSQIAENIVGVATAAQSTSSGVADTQTAAAELARMSNELQSLVGAFRY